MLKSRTFRLSVKQDLMSRSTLYSGMDNNAYLTPPPLYVPFLVLLILTVTCNKSMVFEFWPGQVDGYIVLFQLWRPKSIEYTRSLIFVS